MTNRRKKHTVLGGIKVSSKQLSEWGKSGGRPKVYSSNAERARAFRLRKKQEKLFSQFPHNTQEFKDRYEKVERDKIKFLYVSLIPRKPDGKVDWIKWQSQEEKEDKLFTSTEIKNYLENKTNPTLQKWYDDLKSDPDPVKRLALMNEQLEENINITLPVSLLYKVGKNKGWIDKEYLLESFKPSFKDEANNQIKIDFDINVKYDITKWN